MTICTDKAIEVDARTWERWVRLFTAQAKRNAIERERAYFAALDAERPQPMPERIEVIDSRVRHLMQGQPKPGPRRR